MNSLGDIGFDSSVPFPPFFFFLSLRHHQLEMVGLASYVISGKFVNIFEFVSSFVKWAEQCQLNKAFVRLK